MNFNFSNQPEYSLNTSLTNELINLYGIPIKFLVVQKINKDDIVFGDFSHLKTDSDKIFTINALPENSENWDQTGFDFNSFGLTNFDSISLFVSRSSMDEIFPDMDDSNGFNDILGNLLVLPNDRILEITNIEWEVPGINNLYTNNDVKSVYVLSCKTYDMKLVNEVDNLDISNEETVEYETLDNYFAELIDTADDQKEEVEVIPQVTTVQKTGDIDNKIKKPIIDKTEDDVFGKF